MYTQCPQCMTYFQVTAEHLKIAQGNVRCGHCRNVFSALGNLTERLPESSNEESTEFENDDFLTDEELGEFEDFDTNIYDDEDSIFDAFIDDEDNTTAEPVQDQARPNKATKPEPAAKPAPAAKPSTNTTTSARKVAPASNESTTSAIKKLASLREGQKAYLAKLQQAMRQREKEELERQTKIFNASKQSATSPVQARDTSTPQSQTRAAPATKPKSTPTAIPTSTTTSKATAKPKAAPVRNATPPAAPAAKATRPATTNPATRAKQTKPKPAESTSVKNARKTPARKPDIPVQSSGDDVDFDTALQALDELEINDEHADFVASVIREFEATNIMTTPQGTPVQTENTIPPAPANQSIAVSSPAIKENAPRPKPVDATENFTASAEPQAPLKTPPAPVESKTGKTKKFGLRRDKPKAKKKVPKKRLKKVSKRPPPQPVIEANIPTLPAILREGYQDEVAQQRMTPATIAWSVGSMLLMLVFLGQTVYFKHDQLARISAFRPWIEHFCHRFDCEISLQYDASELELLGQDIRSHPKVKNALMVSTTIINKADYRQAYPGLQITFTDLNGQKVAMRRFLPEEYLPKGTDIKRGIPPNTPIQVELQLMDPGSDAINFEFEFFKTI